MWGRKGFKHRYFGAQGVYNSWAMIAVSSFQQLVSVMKHSRLERLWLRGNLGLQYTQNIDPQPPKNDYKAKILTLEV